VLLTSCGSADTARCDVHPCLHPALAMPRIDRSDFERLEVHNEESAYMVDIRRESEMLVRESSK
jgi:hypothetical protein